MDRTHSIFMIPKWIGTAENFNAQIIKEMFFNILVHVDNPETSRT